MLQIDTVHAREHTTVQYTVRNLRNINAWILYYVVFQHSGGYARACKTVQYAQEISTHGYQVTWFFSVLG